MKSVLVRNNRRVLAGLLVCTGFICNYPSSAFAESDNSSVQITTQSTTPQKRTLVGTVVDSSTGAIALPRAGKAGNAVFTAQLGEALAPPGQQLVGVALMADVKQQLVLRKVQHAVQGHRQLHNAEVRRQMAAGQIGRASCRERV